MRKLRQAIAKRCNNFQNKCTNVIVAYLQGLAFETVFQYKEPIFTCTLTLKVTMGLSQSCCNRQEMLFNCKLSPQSPILDANCPTKETVFVMLLTRL
ncbi:unnamed protein product [Larinioides sclopetarius]|uniref:Uncharacterized protein n=1 Tax=Larinioides sclopetarius TaxID=280406 RepID=A0AAV2B2C3_9ARAC